MCGTDNNNEFLREAAKTEWLLADMPITIGQEPMADMPTSIGQKPMADMPTSFSPFGLRISKNIF